MRLPDAMRQRLLDSVITAQKTDHPLLKELDVDRLARTLERDLSEHELASILMVVGGHGDASLRTMHLSLTQDKSKAKATFTPMSGNVEGTERQRSWRVERPRHGGPVRLSGTGARLGSLAR